MPELQIVRDIFVVDKPVLLRKQSRVIESLQAIEKADIGMGRFLYEKYRDISDRDDGFVGLEPLSLRDQLRKDRRFRSVGQLSVSSVFSDGQIFGSLYIGQHGELSTVLPDTSRDYSGAHEYPVLLRPAKVDFSVVEATILVPTFDFEGQNTVANKQLQNDLAEMYSSVENAPELSDPRETFERLIAHPDTIK